MADGSRLRKALNYLTRHQPAFPSDVLLSGPVMIDAAQTPLALDVEDFPAQQPNINGNLFVEQTRVVLQAAGNAQPMPVNVYHDEAELTALVRFAPPHPRSAISLNRNEFVEKAAIVMAGLLAYRRLGLRFLEVVEIGDRVDYFFVDQNGQQQAAIPAQPEAQAAPRERLQKGTIPDDGLCRHEPLRRAPRLCARHAPTRDRGSMNPLWQKAQKLQVAIDSERERGDSGRMPWLYLALGKTREQLASERLTGRSPQGWVDRLAAITAYARAGASVRAERLWYASRAEAEGWPTGSALLVRQHDELESFLRKQAIEPVGTR
jgi:hypothetical protein